MVNVKMTLEDRNKYLSMIDDEIDSKLTSLSESRNVEELQEQELEKAKPDLLNNENESPSIKKGLPTMNLAERDKYLSKVEQEIKSKKELLLEKRKYLKKIEKLFIIMNL